MLPFARELLKRGTHVVVAANETPSINDITAAELEALLPTICQADCTLCKGVSTGRLQVGWGVGDMRRAALLLQEVWEVSPYSGWRILLRRKQRKYVLPVGGEDAMFMPGLLTKLCSRSGPPFG